MLTVLLVTTAYGGAKLYLQKQLVDCIELPFLTFVRFPFVIFKNYSYLFYYNRISILLRQQVCDEQHLFASTEIIHFNKLVQYCTL